MNSQMKIAVLLSHYDDLCWAEKTHPNADYYATEIITIEIHRDKHINYFYGPAVSDHIKYESLQWIIHNWYRDSKGKDNTAEKGFSVCQVISASAQIAFSKLERDFNAFKSLSLEYDKIYISKNETRLFAMVLGKFDDKVVIYNPGHDEKAYYYGGERIHKMPVGKNNIKNKLIKTLRLIQLIIYRNNIKKKKILLSDWTTAEFIKKQRDMLSTNNRKISKSAYLVPTSKKLENSHLIPVNLNEIIERSDFIIRLSHHFCLYENSLLELFYDYLSLNYSENRKIIISWYNTYSDLIKWYNPEEIILPGEMYEPYLILAQICKHKSIKTKLLSDGYNVITKLSTVMRDITGDGPLIPVYFAMGRSGVDDMLGNGRLPEQIEYIEPPIKSLYKVIPKKQKIYDVIVMTWVPIDTNPNARPDYIFLTLKQVLEVLDEIGFRSIAIKIKNEMELRYVELVLKIAKIQSKITILTGMFYTHVGKSDFVVGGLSTGVAECILAGVPYFVYEPKEHGYAEEWIKNGIIAKQLVIYRSVAELKENILKKNSTQQLNSDQIEYLGLSTKFNKVIV